MLQNNISTVIYPEKVFIRSKKSEKWDSTPIMLPDESFSSWLTRLAKENYSDVNLLYKKYNKGKSNTITLNKELESIQYTKKTRIKFFKNISEFLKLEENQERIILKSPFIESLPGGKWNYFLQPLKYPNYCPQCLNNDIIPYFRYYWYLRFYAVCHIHHIVLKECCPHCHSPIKFWMTEWGVPMIQCYNCKKNILDIHFITNISKQQSSQIQLFLLLAYKKDRLYDASINSGLFFKYFFKTIIAISEDPVIKQLSDNYVEIPNERLFSGIIMAYNFILEDIERLEYPYLCEIDDQIFKSQEELNVHNQREHFHFQTFDDVDDVAKFRYEIIAPLIGMNARTVEVVDKRAKMYGKSRKTLYRYIRKFEQHGINGLKDLHFNCGRRKTFSEEAEEIIVKHLENRCSCCDYNSTIPHHHKMIKKECLKLGLRFPSWPTIYRRKMTINQMIIKNENK